MLGDFVPLGPAQAKRRETSAGGRQRGGGGQWGESAWVVCDDDDKHGHKSKDREEEGEGEDKKKLVKRELVRRGDAEVVEHRDGGDEEEEEKHVDWERRRRQGRRRTRPGRREDAAEKEKEDEKEGWTGGVEVRGMCAEFPAAAIDAPQYGVENFRLEVAPHHTSARGTQFVEYDGTLSPCDPLTVYPTRMVPARVDHTSASDSTSDSTSDSGGTVVLLFEQGWRFNGRRVEVTLEYSQHPYTAKLLDSAVLDLAAAAAAAVDDDHYPVDAAARYAGQQRVHHALALPLPSRLHCPVAGTVALRLAGRPVADWRALADPDAPVPVPYEAPDDL